MNINKLDLNLLKVLSTLWSEGSVSRAAERLNVTQPAISHALARAREAFGDELMVRDKGRMVPTPFAHRIQGRIDSVLRELQEVFDEDRRGSGTVEFTLNIGMADYTQILFFEKIYSALSDSSSNAKVVTRHVSHNDLSDDLSSGKIDLALSFNTRDFSNLHEEVMFEDQYVCLIKKEMPGHLSLDSYAQSRHVMISYDGQLSGLADAALKRVDRVRTVLVSTPHVFTAASLVAKRGFVMTCPLSIAKALIKDYPLRIARVPFDMPRLPLTMHWHSRTDADRVCRWARSEIRGIITEEAARYL